MTAFEIIPMKELTDGISDDMFDARDIKVQGERNPKVKSRHCVKAKWVIHFCSKVYEHTFILSNLTTFRSFATQQRTRRRIMTIFFTDEDEFAFANGSWIREP